jgi:hypothetical protein
MAAQPGGPWVIGAIADHGEDDHRPTHDAISGADIPRRRAPMAARPWQSLSHHGSSLDRGHGHPRWLRPGFSGVSHATKSADQFAGDP